MTAKQIAKKYCRNVSNRIPCAKRLKAPMIDRLENEVLSYLEDNPQADMMEIEYHFGTPNLIAESYISELGINEVLGALKIRQKIIRVIAGAVAVALIIWVIAVGLALYDIHGERNGHADDRIVEEVIENG